MIPQTRQQFTDYCLRKLGDGVIEINMSEEQTEDRVDEALEYYAVFHYNGTERTFVKHQVTANNIANGWIQMPESISGVIRIIPLNSGSSIAYMFDARYQIRLNDIATFQPTSLANYAMTKQYINSMEFLMTGVSDIRFNSNQHRLYIDWDWKTIVAEGQWIIVECYEIIDPAVYASTWKEHWFVEFTTAMLKQQWGSNLKKYGNVQLPGGITLDGKTIYDEATQDIERLKVELKETYQEPPAFIMG